MSSVTLIHASGSRSLFQVLTKLGLICVGTPLACMLKETIAHSLLTINGMVTRLPHVIDVDIAIIAVLVSMEVTQV